MLCFVMLCYAMMTPKRRSILSLIFTCLCINKPLLKCKIFLQYFMIIRTERFNTSIHLIRKLQTHLEHFARVGKLCSSRLSKTDNTYHLRPVYKFIIKNFEYHMDY